jgi:hypothetical protein
MANKYLKDLEDQRRILDKKIDTAVKNDRVDEVKILKMKKAYLELDKMIQQVKRVDNNE